MITNFHTHTNRCCHAEGSEEDYVSEAIRQGVVQMGFSDHAPFPDYDFGFRMQYNELNDYLSAIEQSQRKHKGEIQLFKGLEIEYFPHYQNYYRELFDKYRLDYLALGEHMYIDANGKRKNIFFANSTQDYIDYANAVCEAIETKLFSFVAHPDVMFTNPFNWDSSCENASRLIIDCAEKNDVILEFNANGIRKNVRAYPEGIRCPYPHKSFWEIVQKTNIRVIIGSDNHIPSQIHDDYVRKAEQMAHRWGLNVVQSIDFHSYKY